MYSHWQFGKSKWTLFIRNVVENQKWPEVLKSRTSKSCPQNLLVLVLRPPGGSGDGNERVVTRSTSFPGSPSYPSLSLRRDRYIGRREPWERGCENFVEFFVEFLRPFLKSHFPRKLAVAWQNVGCFLSLYILSYCSHGFRKRSFSNLF